MGKGFVLNILNPFVWIFWLGTVAVTAGKMKDYNLAVSFLDGHHNFKTLLFFVIVLGTSLGCDMLKAKGASFLKRFFNQKRIKIMNLVIGWGLVLFGLYFIAKGLIQYYY